MKITKKQIMDLKSCYNRQRIDELAAGRDSIDHTEIACLPIPWWDKIWVLTRLMTPSQQDRYARRVALDVVDLWSAPQVVIDWLRTGDETLRDAAEAAAAAAAARAEAAERVVMRAAAARAAMRATEAAAWWAAAWAAAAAEAADAKPDREDTYLQWAVEGLERWK